jgi:hypothetical protein
MNAGVFLWSAKIVGPIGVIRAFSVIGLSPRASDHLI